jgi:GTP 3',8-cyclase
MLWSNHKLRLVVTNQCNLNCFYCHNEGQPKANNFLSVELFQHLLRVIHRRNEGLEIVTFSGGEPLLHENLEHFVRALQSVTRQRTVVTNGLLLDKRRLASLREAGVTKFRIGVDSLIRSHSRPGSALPQTRSIHEVLELLQSEQMHYELNVVLTEFNRNELLKLLRFCREHQVSAKFFEHIKVMSVRSAAGVTEAEAQPYVPFGEFESALRIIFPDAVHSPSGVFDGANEFYDCGRFSIRYCRYLCGYGLCHLTGTRIDPRGFAYACLVGNGRFQISPEQSVQESTRVVEEAVACGCVSRVQLTSQQFST